jgi:MFS family permease
MPSTPRFAALQTRDFRLFWFGRLFSATGAQMQFTAVNWHVVELLRGENVQIDLGVRTLALDAAALGVGALGLVRLVPIIFFALLGGIIADNYDRRRILFISQSAALLFAGALAAVTLTGNVSVLLIYLLSAGGAAATAFDEPARQSLVANLVPRVQLSNAVSLNTLLSYLATIIGPALAGILIGSAGLGVVYVIGTISVLAVLAALLFMRYRRPADAARVGFNWAAFGEGLRFTLRSRLIFSTMLLDFFATFFASARTMLPLIATDILGLGAAGFGFLSTAQPVGAVIAGLILSLRRDIDRQGVVLLISVALYGLATALFGLSTHFALSYFLFAFTGVGDTISTVIRGTIRQLVTPDELRGRMTSVNMVFFMGGPQLGELEAGLVASLFGVPFSIVSGGLATVALTAWIAWRYPRLRNYRHGDYAI